MRTLFDLSGQRIPFTVYPYRRFHYRQPWMLDYENRWDRLEKPYDDDTLVPRDEFRRTGERLLTRLEREVLVRQILCGVHLPICLPKLSAPEYFGSMHEAAIQAVGVSFRTDFPTRSFHSYRDVGDLSEYSFSPESRHRTLLLLLFQAPRVALFFPSALQGFSVQSANRQMADLPPGFFLAGVLDSAVALTMYPDILARDYEVPYLNCSAVVRADDSSLRFGVGEDGKLWFGMKKYLSPSEGRETSGLIYIGPAVSPF